MPTSWVANSCQRRSRRRRGPKARVDRNLSIPAKIDIEIWCDASHDTAPISRRLTCAFLAIGRTRLGGDRPDETRQFARDGSADHGLWFARAHELAMSAT